MNVSNLRSTILAVLLAGATSAVFGASATYSSRGTWNSAVSGATTDDFETYGWSNPNGDFLSNPVTLGTTTYSYTGSSIFGVNSTALTYDASYLTGSYLEWQYGGTMKLTFGSSVTAFGVDFGEFYGGVRTFTFAFNNGDTFSASNASNDYGFFGLTTDAAFSSVDITASGDYALIDKVSTASGSVPEGGTTVLMIALGFLGIAAARRRAAKA